MLAAASLDEQVVTLDLMLRSLIVGKVVHGVVLNRAIVCSRVASLLFRLCLEPVALVFTFQGVFHVLFWAVLCAKSVDLLLFVVMNLFFRAHLKIYVLTIGRDISCTAGVPIRDPLSFVVLVPD